MKKSLSFMLALVMAFTLFCTSFTVSAAPVAPAGFSGITGTYAIETVGGQELICISFAVAGDTNVRGNVFKVAIQHNPAKLTWGHIATGAATATPFYAMKADLNGPLFPAYSATMNNDAMFGWASNLIASKKGEDKATFETGLDPVASKMADLGIVKVAGETGFNVGSTAANTLPLFKVYYKPAAGVTLDQISESDFSLFPSSTDVPTGSSVIKSGAVSNNKFTWLGFNSRITSTAGVGGTIAPLGTKTYAAGESADYVITPSTGYEIDFVTVNSERIDLDTAEKAGFTYTFDNISTDQVIHAAFKAKGAPPSTDKTVSATATAGGTIAPGTAVVATGATANFTITKLAGYDLQDILFNGTTIGAAAVTAAGTAGTYTTPAITADASVHAIFKLSTQPPVVQYNVDATTDMGGTISPMGMTYHNAGASPVYNIEATQWYTFENIEVTIGAGSPVIYAAGNPALVAAGTGYTYQFPALASNAKIHANFKMASPTVTSPAPGAIVPDPTPTVTGTGEPGSTITVTTTPTGGGTPVTTTTTVGPDGTWTVDVPALPDGPSTISVTQTDPDGNISTPIVVNISVETVKKFKITGKVSYDIAYLGAKVGLYNGTTLVQEVTTAEVPAANANYGKFEFTDVPELATGTYTVKATKVNHTTATATGINWAGSADVAVTWTMALLVGDMDKPNGLAANKDDAINSLDRSWLLTNYEDPAVGAAHDLTDDVLANPTVIIINGLDRSLLLTNYDAVGKTSAYNVAP